MNTMSLDWGWGSREDVPRVLESMQVVILLSWTGVDGRNWLNLQNRGLLQGGLWACCTWEGWEHSTWHRLLSWHKQWWLDSCWSLSSWWYWLQNRGCYLPAGSRGCYCCCLCYICCCLCYTCCLCYFLLECKLPLITKLKGTCHPSLPIISYKPPLLERVHIQQ